MPRGVYQRPGGPIPRTSTFVSPLEAHVEAGVIDETQVAKANESIFKAEKVRPKPFSLWVCLDSDGIETQGCENYEWIGPIGGHPRCPNCGSRVALPFEAYELNEKNRIDKMKREW
jgi:hypothetical protein